MSGINTEHIVSDERIAQMTVGELEDLEFRVYVELRNREDAALAAMTAEDEDDSLEEFDDSLPF